MATLYIVLYYSVSINWNVERVKKMREITVADRGFLSQNFTKLEDTF